MDHDLMFLRNLVHGAPMKQSYLAARLKKIDQRLKRESRYGDRWTPKSDDYYLELAARLTELSNGS